MRSWKDGNGYSEWYGSIDHVNPSHGPSMINTVGEDYFGGGTGCIAEGYAPGDGEDPASYANGDGPA